MSLRLIEPKRHSNVSSPVSGSVALLDAGGEQQGQTQTLADNNLRLHIAWLRDFEKQHGRALRVLHVGNIANNAYLNAKFLRRVGVEAHVLCHDYYHVMAMPEWEDVEINEPHGNDFQPRFSPKDLRGYRRPAWFFNGPSVSCAMQIRAFSGGALGQLRLFNARMFERFVVLTRTVFGARIGYAIQLLFTSPELLLWTIWKFLRSRLGADSRSLNLIAATFKSVGIGPPKELQIEVQHFIDAHDESFPEHKGHLLARDIIPYQMSSTNFQDVFHRYDIVQCYATDPIHALVAGKRPYIAFEHGTLRDFTMARAPLHRLTALAYRQSDHAFISNGDCLAYAERLGIPNYSPIIHPVDVEQHRQDFGEAIPALRRDIGGDVILFCPLRHDWKVKGTDIHLRALPLIKKRILGRVKIVLIRWGAQLAESEALLSQLGCAEDVIWTRSICRIVMIKYMRAADVVLDQLALPHFGATAPQSIAAGTPVISSYRPESTRWIIPEAAPILSAFTADDVADAVVQALDPTWRTEYKRRAQDWTDRYHHPNHVIQAHLAAYRRVLMHERSGNRAQAPL